ncbi:MAG: dienelactone hydrolase family protein [Armatimonadetes bacterium]|nr:dienelactone hydrolase family protein [Armatimonadota bacterium]
MKYWLSALAALTCAVGAQADLHTETVEYRQGDTVLEGYLAYDTAVEGKRPGVMVAHEWMGLGPYAKRRVDQLASLGYVAFAADIYGKGIRPTNREEAAAQAGKYRKDRPLLRARARAGLDFLKSHDLVDSKRVAAIGYCFGGGTVLELARSGADLAGAVSFHGNLDTPDPADAKNIKAKILVLHGANDSAVPPEQVAAFMDEMRKAGVDWQFVAYGGAVHSFTNPDSGSDKSRGAAYDEKADHRSWEAMKSFFAELFKQT